MMYWTHKYRRFLQTPFNHFLDLQQTCKLRCELTHLPKLTRTVPILGFLHPDDQMSMLYHRVPDISSRKHKPCGCFTTISPTYQVIDMFQPPIRSNRRLPCGKPSSCCVWRSCCITVGHPCTDDIRRGSHGKLQLQPSDWCFQPIPEMS